MNKEIWKDVPGYEGLYRVSSLGLIKGLKRIVSHPQSKTMTVKEVIRKPSVNKYGYSCLGLSKRGVFKQFTVHRLIALTFIPNLENKPCVNHINGIKTDNRIENLEWCTYSENNQHAFDNGLMVGKIGYENPTSKEVIQLDLNRNEIARYGSTSRTNILKTIQLCGIFLNN